MNKYRNKETEVNGIIFDSKKEAERYEELLLLERAKKISNLMLQPKFTLQEGFKVGKKKHRPITYVSDFMYFDRHFEFWVVEDSKGMKTEVYKIKKKLFLKKYPEYLFIES